jgi:hypothetical protein
MEQRQPSSQSFDISFSNWVSRTKPEYDGFIKSFKSRRAKLEEKKVVSHMSYNERCSTAMKLNFLRSHPQLTTKHKWNNTICQLYNPQVI